MRFNDEFIDLSKKIDIEMNKINIPVERYTELIRAESTLSLIGIMIKADLPSYAITEFLMELFKGKGASKC